jgi:glucokinase
MADLALAVDIGGTKMAVGLVTGEGVLLHRKQVPTRAGGPAAGHGGPVPVVDSGHPDPAEALWGDVESLIGEVLGQVDGGDRVVVCGAGCGGPMSPGGGVVSPLNIPAWRGFPLRAALARSTGLPTFVDNDAKALALGEGWVGAAAGYRDYIAMVVSTGVGGGIVLDGRLLDGRLGNAGHIGHVCVVPDGRACVCGSRGCLEAEVSGTAIMAITGQPAKAAPIGIKERAGTLTGRAVGVAVNLLDLDLAVVSGSVALGFGDVFFAAAQRELERRCGLDFTRGARIVPGGLGDEGPLIGAAQVGWRGLRRTTDATERSVDVSVTRSGPA